MYETIKTLARRLLPEAILKKNESRLRRIVAWQYRGNRHQCNICDFRLDRFVELSNTDWLCPNCGSLPPHPKVDATVERCL